MTSKKKTTKKVSRNSDSQEPEKAQEQSQDQKPLKKLASTFKQYLNHQYQANISYVPDKDEIPKVTVNKWLEMSEAFQEAVGLSGLPVGNITHVYGKPNTGKTSLLMEAVVQAQKQNYLPIVILTEHKFPFDRLEDFMGGDPEEMLVLHAENIEQAYSFMEKILNDLKSGVLVVEDEQGNDVEIDVTGLDVFMMLDSIGNTMSQEELEYDTEDGDKSMGKHAKALKRLTKRINRLLGKPELRQRAGILLLNQSYTSMPTFGPSVETPYGGDAVPYSCILNIRLKRKKDLSMKLNGKETVIGLETIVEVKKNHITHKMPKSSLYTVASGLLKPTKEDLDEFKKKHLK